MRVAQKTSSASARVAAGARNAAAAVSFYRVVASSDAKVKALQKQFQGIQIKYQNRKLQTDDNGRQVTLQIISEKDTVNTNKHTFDEQAMRDLMAETVDSAHEDNIQ